MGKNIASYKLQKLFCFFENEISLSFFSFKRSFSAFFILECQKLKKMDEKNNGQHIIQ